MKNALQALDRLGFAMLRVGGVLPITQFPRDAVIRTAEFSNGSALWFGGMLQFCSLTL